MQGRLIDYSLIGVCFTLMIATISLISVYVPTEEQMGVVQRIFYFHVPLAWVAFLAFFVVFIMSLLYIWKGDEKWDFRAYASAEIGVVFTTMVLITGPIWAKSAWGTWWTWDMRLTTTLVLWFIYVAYLMVRSFASDEERGARFAAVVGIIGFIDVPVVALAIVLSRTQHPSPIVFEGGLASSMLLTLLVSVAAFTVFYVLLLRLRASTRQMTSEIMKLRQELEI
ncbi:MAG: cytochrome c biogenesis protein CcsA [Dehalococcoidia bacterium]|nr:MAG: cytochrome c biogenesis protein CcsA [Dehalococcoidia bacterium]